MARGHTHINDRQVGLVRGNLAHQVLAVAGLSHHLVPGLLEQTGEALAEQEAVLADRYAHGILA